MLLLLCLPLQGCGEMLTALSSVAEGAGSVCEVFEVSTSVYMNGEWHDGAYATVDQDGYDVSHQESNWVSSKSNGYLDLWTSNTYYATSPYSGFQYKFYVYCYQWAPQNNYNYNYY